ncbi:hypothetical protein [Oligoflexus tunisiensis]|uniref:hypothetical protein n=1 Tax=Oligoflexus tunisiensis TaxID=708132 RepID=UPI00114CF047|nr:hypothetical protein [Oligoflexus tunisiensis]
MNNGAEGQMRVVSSGKEITGSARIVHVTQRDAVLRGLKTFALTVLAALATIIIPGVHFISVPGGLIAAPIVGVMVFMKSRGAVKGMSGSFTCPQCGGSNVLDYQEGKPPYYGSCPTCKSPYQAFPA